LQERKLEKSLDNGKGYRGNKEEVMKLKLKDDKVFKNTIDGVYVEIGGESVEVDDKVGQYLLDNFPAIVEVSAAKMGKVKAKEV
jgi:hypothetical protein